MKLKGFLFIYLLALLTSCAGPMNPFGAINHNQRPINSLNERNPSSYLSNTKALINFFPSRQNWHQSINFKARIFDENGLGSRRKVRFFYNDKDISEQILEIAKKSISKDEKTLTYTIEDFRLNLEDENRISVVYQRDEHSSPLIKHYEEPVCPIDSVQKVQDLGPFADQKKTFSSIEKISLKEGMNPSLLAGLIAQESAFNPKAISWAKAIGLTQVTSLAEQHVIEKHPDWPRYEGLSGFSYPRVKSLILMGKINKDNEWRLNKEMSIKGGIEYLRFVESYWSTKANKDIIEKVFPNKPEIYEDVILASYNSGPFRVKKSIFKLEENWLESDKLVEAKKYVRKVKSYCYHFSNASESYAPLTASSL
ncbi:MAG: hypothetical protein ACJAT2_001399 [Bacteriovoracaceae bacterium]|jgi:hypothetical protein